MLNPMKGIIMRRHTVILGAGATIATIPNGDRNGNKSSVMNGLIEKLNLNDVISNVELNTKSKNLEDIYSELYLREDCRDVVKELEKRIYDYFASLELPEYPTIYDLLILSLTSKDVITTFNWDPLLIQAYCRCSGFTENLPHIFCLHGNVVMGYCEKDVEFGINGVTCPVCESVFTPTKLLYPVKEKNYSKDDYINKCWEATEQCIEQSSMLTIFGYSAPTTDKEAVTLLKKAWGDLESRQLEEVSVIDIVSEDEMLDKWKDFIYSHHYKYTNDFYSSYLGKFPRRTCETIFATFLMNLPADDTRGFYEGMSWDDITDILSDLLIEEINTPNGENYPCTYNRN